MSKFLTTVGRQVLNAGKREFATMPDSLNILGVGLTGNMGKSIRPNLEDLKKRGYTLSMLGNNPGHFEVEGVKCYYASSKDEGKRLPPRGEKFSLLIYSAKPDQVDSILGQCAENGNIDSNTVIASVAAGVTVQGLKRASKGLSDQIIRLMPNKLADVRMSATTYTTSGNVQEEKLDYVLSLFSKVGKTFAVEESEMNKSTALAGSGPASPWSIYKLMQESLRRHGLNEEEARKTIIEVAKDFDNLAYVAKEGSKVDAALKHVQGGSMRTARAMIDSAIEDLGSDCTDKERKQLIAGILMQVRSSKIKGAVAIGIDPAMAGSIVRDLIVGTAIMSEKTGEDFTLSAESVTSRNGTTRALLGHLLVDKGDGKGHDFDDIYARGMQAAVDRGEQIGDSLKYTATKFAAELSANEKSPERIQAARSAIVVAYNQARSALNQGAEVSRDDSSIDYKSLQNPSASQVSPKSKGSSKEA